MAGTLLEMYIQQIILPRQSIRVGGGGDRQPMIIVASRGRNPNNPSDRTKGAKTEQRLEINSDGLCNTLMSVQKDNIVMERVKISQPTNKGYIECEIGGVADMSYPGSSTRRGRVQENGTISPTITATETEVCRIEKPSELGFMDNGTGKHQSNTVYSTDSISPTLTTIKDGGTQQIKVSDKYRIRKLTPKECWRLMGFTDEQFGKAEKVNSNTQLYKEAGNSIVVNVLVAILSNLLSN